MKVGDLRGVSKSRRAAAIGLKGRSGRGVLGRRQRAPSYHLGGALPAGSGVELRPPSGFPIFRVLYILNAAPLESSSSA